VMLAGLHAGSPDLVVVGALALSGVGMGIATPAMNATVANAVDPSDLGVASAAAQLMAQIGTVSGIQLMQTVQVARESADGLAGSYHAAYLLGAVVAALAFVTSRFVHSAPARSWDDVDDDLDVEAEEVPALAGAGATR
jgi:MFS family permease